MAMIDRRLAAGEKKNAGEDINSKNPNPDPARTPWAKSWRYRYIGAGGGRPYCLQIDS